MIYLFLIIVQVIVNLKNKPEAVEKVGRNGNGRRLPGGCACFEGRWLAQAGGAALACLQPTTATRCHSDPARQPASHQQRTPLRSPWSHPFFLSSPLPPLQVHLFCAVYFMLYMVAFTGITIWWVDRLHAAPAEPRGA